MNVETLNELGSSRPPKPSWAAALNVELKRIAELEAALGEEPGKPIFNVVSARIRVAKLQAKLEAKQHPQPESEMGPNELTTALTVAADRANKLEAELGLPKGAPSATLEASRLRASHLEQLLASRKTPATAAALPAAAEFIATNLAPAPSLSAVLTAAQFLALAPDAQAVFSENGGAINVDSFNSLPAAARVKFFGAGGRIVATAGDKSRRIPGNDNRPASGGITLAAFCGLGKKDQAMLVRLGVQITAK